jgi:hypothetical protein
VNFRLTPATAINGSELMTASTIGKLALHRDLSICAPAMEEDRDFRQFSARRPNSDGLSRAARRDRQGGRKPLSSRYRLDEAFCAMSRNAALDVARELVPASQDRAPVIGEFDPQLKIVAVARAPKVLLQRVVAAAYNIDSLASQSFRGAARQADGAVAAPRSRQSFKWAARLSGRPVGEGCQQSYSQRRQSKEQSGGWFKQGASPIRQGSSLPVLMRRPIDRNQWPRRDLRAARSNRLRQIWMIIWPAAANNRLAPVD